MVDGHPLPIIKNFSLLFELSVMQRGVQELRDTCRIDGIPLQEESATGRILEALTKAVEVTKRILLQLEEGYTPPLPCTTAAVDHDEAALNLSRINAALKEYETAITTAADGRATIPSLLCRLVKKCKQYPHLKQKLVGECPGSSARGSGRSQTESSYGIARGGVEQLGSSKLGIER